MAQMTAVRAANAADQAKALGRALAFYKNRIGEPGIGPEFVARVAEAFESAQAAAAQARKALEDPQETAKGRGQRSQASGPRDQRDAVHRLVALILGNPTGSTTPDKVYAGLKAYDGVSATAEGEACKVSEETVNTFSAMRDWSPEDWASLEARLETRMEGVQTGCGDCRRYASLATRKGWEVRPCRSHRPAA